jgi:hypothetical protein
VRLLSWFLDAATASFGVDRMALASKAAGKDGPMWFGRSAAAGALRWFFFSLPLEGFSVLSSSILVRTLFFGIFFLLSRDLLPRAYITFHFPLYGTFHSFSFAVFRTCTNSHFFFA